jgi:hypothetical protein
MTAMLRKRLLFKIDENANGQGEMIIDEEENVPIEVTVKQFKVKTKNNCMSRKHEFSLYFDHNLIHGGVYTDCISYLHQESVTIKDGKHKFKFIADGYNPGEKVTAIIEIKVKLI